MDIRQKHALSKRSHHVTNTTIILRWNMRRRLTGRNNAVMTCRAIIGDIDIVVELTG